MDRNKKLKIVFISSLQYPEGGAPANRHLAYAKGLSELGNKVCFLLTSPQHSLIDKSLNPGIEFTCLAPNKYIRKRGNYYINRSYIEYQSFIKCRQHLIRLHKNNLIDILVLLDINAWRLLPVLRIANQLNIKIIHERTEYPFLINNESIFKKMDLFLYYKLILHRFNGLFVISNAIKRHLIEDIKLKIPIVIINMIVDPSRFEFKIDNNYSGQPYIAYCGSMEGDKDGVEILIRAFGKAINQYSFCPELKLILIGDISNKEIAKKLRKIALDSNCLDRIIFTGKVDRDKMPLLLSNAKALALARPSNKQAEGGFPTKLGEYLATGKPVIITRVGEIENFLNDGENSFLAQPNDVDSFASQIGNVFRDYNKAICIGEEGRKLIYSVFNNKVQAKLLNDFMLDVINMKYEN
jgi:glycosyltransferase involved in cell wall biosynthesis